MTDKVSQKLNTDHRIFFQDARKMDAVKSDSIDLVITSPPYPMIEMWDDDFGTMNPGIAPALKNNDGKTAFQLMHQELDLVWDEVVRVLKKGGFACINIGDATRTLSGNFMLYPNHSRVLSALHERGLSPLPAVIWRKQTNAPTKFMGSGVLPAGAYVTLEHEYILILRKGEKRIFNSDEMRFHRQNSAIFWEERNQWFSDIWMDLKGTRQKLVEKRLRKRSGAFPFELPYRLINMYSVKGDTVLDPFLGTGATMLAAMTSCRNSVGFEIDSNFTEIIGRQANTIVGFANGYISERIERHKLFVCERLESHKELKHHNTIYGFPVIMGQEKNLLFNPLLSIEKKGESGYFVEYSGTPEASTSAARHFQQMELNL